MKYCIYIPLVLAVSLHMLTAQPAVSPTPKPQQTDSATPADETTDVAEETEKSSKEPDADEKQRIHDKKGAEYIEKTIKFGTHKERAQAISNIKRIKTQQYLDTVLTTVVKNLKDESDPSVIRNSFQIVSRYERKDAIGPVSAHLDHSDRDVQIAAVYALKDLEAREKIGVLRNRLKELDFSDNSGLIEALLVTLAKFKDTTLFEFAKEKIEDPNTNDFNRQRLILFLGNSNTQESAPYLTTLFTNEDEDITIRSYAVSSLSKLGARSAVPDINREIKRIESYTIKKRRNYHTFYMYCIAALVNLEDSSAYPILEESLKSDSAAVRLKSIDLMEDLKDKRSIDILTYKAKYDPNARVRSAAESALKTAFDINIDEEDGESGSAEEDAPVMEDD
ncbi:MAG: HEAT repeat domain-containing protein, partial [Spirochaetota bacterium]